MSGPLPGRTGTSRAAWGRLLAPVAALAVLGAVSIPFPQLLGNGHDVAEQAFLGQINPRPLLALMLLRPRATLLCLSSGAPGGLFTPSMALGALLGAVLGLPCAWLCQWAPPGLFALVGAAAIVAATTQGPVSSIVLITEPTGYARSAIIPLLIAVATATLLARTIEPRSIYDARLTDAQAGERQRSRERGSGEVERAGG
jgi:CIC family chloride channel protein